MFVGDEDNKPVNETTIKESKTCCTASSASRA